MRLNYDWRIRLSVVGIIMAGLLLLPDYGWLVEAQTNNPTQVSYRQGAVVVKNVGTKPIAVIGGTFSYDGGNGRMLTPTWTYQFPGALFSGRRYFQPNEELTFPPTPTPNDSSQTIGYSQVSVTGVVFADGTTWGGTGDSLRRSLLAQAGATYAELNDILKVLRNESLETIKEVLRGPSPIIKGRDPSGYLHEVLRTELLDRGRHVYPDAIERLERMMAHLGDLIDR
jgi:hypothetical protein